MGFWITWPKALLSAGGLTVKFPEVPANLDVFMTAPTDTNWEVHKTSFEGPNRSIENTNASRSGKLE